MQHYFAWFGLPGSFVLTCLLSLFSLVLAVLFPSPARWICLGAMLLSSAGDIFLMRFRGLDRVFPNYFLIGAAFFMAAHLVYAACFAVKIHTCSADFWNLGASFMLGIAIFCFIFFSHACMTHGKSDTFPLIAVYIAIISVNCAMVFSYGWSQGARNPLAIAAVLGVVSFFVSDLIIGLGMAMGNHRYDHLIWVFYPIGQFLLIAGVGR